MTITPEMLTMGRIAFMRACHNEFEPADEELQAAFEAMIAAQPRHESEWKMVPRVPTEEMLDAWFAAERGVALEGTTAYFAPAYQAMLSASPQPPEEDAPLGMAGWLTNGAKLHPLTINLVVRFARALARKLADAEKKYGYSDGWRASNWMDECRSKLMEHIAKGDPRDVAAYCAFLWHHGESTASPQPPQTTRVKGGDANVNSGISRADVTTEGRDSDTNAQTFQSSPQTDVVREALEGLRTGLNTCPLRPLYTAHSAEQIDTWWMKYIRRQDEYVRRCVDLALRSLPPSTQGGEAA